MLHACRMATASVNRRPEILIGNKCALHHALQN
jgi:hypothetical protein